jgi:hypothetical protein
MQARESVVKSEKKSVERIVVKTDAVMRTKTPAVKKYVERDVATVKIKSVVEASV